MIVLFLLLGLHATIPVGMILFGLSFERSPRHTCAVCNYDLRASPTGRCSECGHIGREHETLQLKRLWLMAAGIMLIALPLALDIVVFVVLLEQKLRSPF